MFTETSVSGIIDAFNDVIEFIQDLPIREFGLFFLLEGIKRVSSLIKQFLFFPIISSVDVILAAIDAVLDPIFGFVGEKIQQGLASLGITLPGTFNFIYYPINSLQIVPHLSIMLSIVFLWIHRFSNH